MTTGTMRQQMLDVVQQRGPDRVPFIQYADMAAPNEDLWKLVGREHMRVLVWTGTGPVPQ